MTNILLTWAPPDSVDRIQAAAEAENMDFQYTENTDEIMKLLPEAEIACVAEWTPEMYQAAKKLRWVHAFSGGISKYIFPEFVASDVAMTSLKGCFNIPGAEYALAVMLAVAKKLAYDISRRASRKFEVTEPAEIYGKTVGIIGLGGIGEEIAKRSRDFGMTVLAMASNQRPQLACVNQWYSPELRDELLGRSDYVIVAVPLTEQTTGMIDASVLSAMKPTGFLVDVSGRPAVYDLDALIEALRNDRIAGASLQIIPDDDSPLWDLENLIISFHRIVSGEQMSRITDMLCENIRRYSRGEPLLGLVDKKAGY